MRSRAGGRVGASVCVRGMVRGRVGWGLCVLVAAAACAGPSALADDPSRWLADTFERRADVEPVEVLVDALEIILRPGRTETELRFYRVIRVNTAAGLRAANHRFFGFREADLAAFEGRVTRPDGTTESLGVDDLRVLEAERGAGRAVPDRWTWSVAAPGVVPGAVIELAYTLRRDYLLWYHDYLSRARYPIRARQLTLVYPAALEIDTRQRGFTEAPAPPSARVRRRTWRMRTEGPIRKQHFAPPVGRTAPLVRYRVSGSVATRGDPGRHEALAALAARLRSAVDQAPAPPSWPEDPQAAAAAAWDWVRRRVVARAPLFAGRRLRAARAVLADGTGTYDELAMLTYAVLRKAGRRVSVLLVPGADRPDVEVGFPSPADVSNDLVVEVDGRAFVDPRCIRCEAGPVLAASHRGRRALQVEPGTAGALAVSVRTTPAGRAEDFIGTQRLRLALQGGALLVDEYAVALSPLAAARWRGWLEDHPHSLEWTERQARRGYFDFIDGGTVGPPDPRSPRLFVRGGRLRSARFVRAGDDILVTMADLFPTEWLSRARLDDVGPLVLDRFRGFDRDVWVALGDARARVSTGTVAVRGPAGAAYTAAVDLFDVAVALQERLVIPERIIPAEQRSEWNAFVTRVQRARRRALVLAPPRGGSAGP